MNDVDLIHAIRRLLATENQLPKDTTPLDLLQTVRFLVQRADEANVWPSQDTLAEQLASSPDAIAKSQKRLRDNGWLVVRKGGYRGRTNSYSVDLDKVPLGDLSRTVISDSARKIAASYGRYVKVTTRKKFMKNWHQQWSFAIQKLLKKTGGDVQKLVGIVNFALTSPTYQRKAQRGPSELKKCWPTLLLDYENYSVQRLPPTVQEETRTEPQRKPEAAQAGPA
jgi:hypothetical protein